MKNVLALIVILGLCSITYVAASSDSVSSVSVSAVGLVEAVPDIAIIKGRVLEQNESADEAVKNAQIKLDIVINYLKNKGLIEEDIQAARVLVNHQWFYPRNKPKELVGFEASADFTAKVRSIEVLSSLYGGLVQAGVSELQPTTFDFSNRDELELQAIANAVVRAEKKAQAGLTPLGKQAGDIITLNINTSWQQPPVFRQERAVMMSAQMDSGPQLNVGNHTVEASVNATFEVD